MNTFSNIPSPLDQFEVSYLLYSLIVVVTFIIFFLIISLILVFIISFFILYKDYNKFISNIEKLISKLRQSKEGENSTPNEYTIKIYQGYLNYHRFWFSLIFALRIGLYALLRIVELVVLNNNDKFNLKNSRNYYNISAPLSASVYFTLIITLGLYHSNLSFKAWFVSLTIYFIHSIISIGFTFFPLISLVSILLYKFRLHIFIVPLHVKNSFKSLYSKSIFAPSLRQGLPYLRLSYHRLDFLSDGLCLFIEYLLSIWCFLSYMIKILFRIIIMIFRLTVLFLVFWLIYNIIAFDLYEMDQVYTIVRDFYTGYILLIKKLLLIKSIDNKDYFLKYISKKIASALNSIFNNKK